MIPDAAEASSFFLKRRKHDQTPPETPASPRQSILGLGPHFGGSRKPVFQKAGMRFQRNSRGLFRDPACAQNVPGSSRLRAWLVPGGDRPGRTRIGRGGEFYPENNPWKILWNFPEEFQKTWIPEDFSGISRGIFCGISGAPSALARARLWGVSPCRAYSTRIFRRILRFFLRRILRAFYGVVEPSYNTFFYAS